MRNLEAICADAETVPLNEVAGSSMGVLTTENRKVSSTYAIDLIFNLTRCGIACAVCSAPVIATKSVYRYGPRKLIGTSAHFNLPRL